MCADMNIDLVVWRARQAKHIEDFPVCLQVFDSIDDDLFLGRGQLVERARMRSQANIVLASKVASLHARCKNQAVVW